MSDTLHETVDVAVIGAGVSGLAAAYELRKRKRSVVVLERELRPGGIIMTERVGEFIVDAGPDALLVQKPAAVALCNELGLGDRMIPTKLPRTAFVLRDGELHPLPGASILGFPTRQFQDTLFDKEVPMAAGSCCTSPAPTMIDRRVVRHDSGPRPSRISRSPAPGIHAGDIEQLKCARYFEARRCRGQGGQRHHAPARASPGELRRSSLVPERPR